MEAVVAFNDFQFNKNSDNVEGLYITVPKRMQGVTSLTKFVAGILHSFSGTSKDGSVSACHRTYKRFQAELKCGAGTICNALKALTEQGIVEKQDKRSAYLYKADKENGYRIELMLFTELFRIRYKKDGKTVEVLRNLTPTEILLYGYFYTYCKSGNRKDVTVTVSYGDIARELGISERSVCSALSTLIGANIIHRNAKEKGVNLHKKSTYHLNEVLRQRRRKKKKEDKSEEKEPKVWVSKAVVDADERANREHWYSIRRASADRLAEDNNKKALSNPDYKALHIAISDECRRHTKMECRGEKVQQSDIERLNKLQDERIKLLSIMGMTDNDLFAHYHCAKCSDTGFMNDGRACDCYKRE